MLVLFIQKLINYDVYLITYILIELSEINDDNWKWFVSFLLSYDYFYFKNKIKVKG